MGSYSGDCSPSTVVTEPSSQRHTALHDEDCGHADTLLIDIIEGGLYLWRPLSNGSVKTWSAIFIF